MHTWKLRSHETAEEIHTAICEQPFHKEGMFESRQERRLQKRCPTCCGVGQQFHTIDILLLTDQLQLLACWVPGGLDHSPVTELFAGSANLLNCTEPGGSNIYTLQQRVTQLLYLVPPEQRVTGVFRLY